VTAAAAPPPPHGHAIDRATVRQKKTGQPVRLIGQPGRIAALYKILGHIADRGNAWIARPIDIANHWRAQFPES